MIDRAPGLITDFYELTMAAAYFENALHHHRAVFDLFIRRLPKHRAYLIVAGLEQALDYLSTLCFTGDQIAYLREHPSFKKVSSEFFQYLAEFRFTGDVWAMPEGTAAFGMEPLVRVSAPIIEAQIIETFLLSTINFQTMIASKAARIVTAAGGRDIVEFGTRRAHGTEAGLLAARAAYIGGCIGSSNVEAGYLFGIPTFGTLAHSFVMTFDDEDEAFRAFLKVFPETATVLVDTYDTIAAVKRLARDFGSRVPAVRLDSGDLLELSKQVRQTLDDASMTDTKIFASGDLNEYKIADLISRGAAIDSFGVGTELATSYDAPALSGVYKLAAIEENGHMSMRIKLSYEKATYPGPKQVWRFSDESGKYARDSIALADEASPGSGDRTTHSCSPLLELVMERGCVIERTERKSAGIANSMKKARWTTLNDARARARRELERLPAELLLLDSEPSYSGYSVGFSERLVEERKKLERTLGKNPI
jgi:nicotinate phosphoribosyltransferase